MIKWSHRYVVRNEWSLSDDQDKDSIHQCFVDSSTIIGKYIKLITPQELGFWMVLRVFKRDLENFKLNGLSNSMVWTFHPMLYSYRICVISKGFRKNCDSSTLS